jgi:glycine dehydrogenase subunit 2
MNYNFSEALMIEPSKPKNKNTLKAFADALIKIAEEAKTQSDMLHNAPSTTLFGRMDEVKAARESVLYSCLHENYNEKRVL